MIFLIGFDEKEVEIIKKTLKEYRVYGIPQYCRDWILQEIVEKAPKLEGDCNWHARKFFLMHNLEDTRVKEVLEKIKSLNLGRIIFATTTPTSLTWRLEDLMGEWIKEDEYFQELRRRKASRFYLDVEIGKS
ncbi:DUF3783 domain-containing protein [Palaeococcus sp. (in: euryarchaeotes)]|uniref:DUF3783 domain-containing protein n=1 Tax=Palaeococcus sp. (in: euryarchaeotes) TaxID=2820298 RepID=UPI0025F3F787|nr:DUF3783 domain-containing protein [Palaeococcus sp. (in: euryarchaeotes)]MCD6559687.1 DUF3783 domain-containing protein [Palaeococcus sp. (in: euryarchaeotes)]